MDTLGKPATDAVARVGRITGVVAAVGTLACVLVATTLDPAFAWTANALSDLGASGGPPQLLFNGGLLAGGVVALPFAAWRVAAASSWVGVLAGASAGATMLAMAGVGAFPIGTALHTPVAVAFFVLATYTLAIDGSAAVLAGRERYGLAWLWVALGHVTAWLLWGAWNALGHSLGLAIPETVGALALGAWIVSTARSPATA